MTGARDRLKAVARSEPTGWVQVSVEDLRSILAETSEEAGQRPTVEASAHWEVDEDALQHLKRAVEMASPPMADHVLQGAAAFGFWQIVGRADRAFGVTMLLPTLDRDGQLATVKVLQDFLRERRKSLEAEGGSA